MIKKKKKKKSNFERNQWTGIELILLKLLENVLKLLNKKIYVYKYIKKIIKSWKKEKRNNHKIKFSIFIGYFSLNDPNDKSINNSERSRPPRDSPKMNIEKLWNTVIFNFYIVLCSFVIINVRWRIYCLHVKKCNIKQYKAKYNINYYIIKYYSI